MKMNDDLKKTLPEKIATSPHTLSCSEICQYYKVDPEHGLDSHKVNLYRERYGSNKFKDISKDSKWMLFLSQFNNSLAKILIGAAFISFFLAVLSNTEDGLTVFVEPCVIVFVLIANAIVSVWQENNAEKALCALKNLQCEFASVLRDSKWNMLPATELVPGDICEVHIGDKVPADIRILSIKSLSLSVEQSQLTGETQAVYKSSEVIDSAEKDCEIQSKLNMLYASTTISNGSAIGIVTSCGVDTEIGIIHAGVQDASMHVESTPLQKKLQQFGDALSKAIGCICVLVWIINIGNFNKATDGGFIQGSVYYFKIAVALAVAAIPEGLTAVITTCLALGTRKMAAQNAIIRKLTSVETLGCTSVICSDKTGTLTTNEMTCVRFSLLSSLKKLCTFRVEGSTYSCVGQVVNLDTQQPFSHITESDKGFIEFVKCLSFCNSTRLVFKDESKHEFKYLGESTEAALKILVEKLGCPDKQLNDKFLNTLHRDTEEVFGDYWRQNYTKDLVLDFTRERKSMSVVCTKVSSGEKIQYIKGAPESILERCSHISLLNGQTYKLTDEIRKIIEIELEYMTSKGLRTLAVAMNSDERHIMKFLKPESPEHKLLMDTKNFSLAEQNMTFCGLVAIDDPPREKVSEAIECCKSAGIRVIMITGDNKKTAETIAHRIGVSSPTEPNAISMTGKEFEYLSDQDKKKALNSQYGIVFSRTEPKHKQMIVRVLKELGEITAMTGDGVNDAPALKLADIGISMGKTGTEVAKEASDMVLADDNFMTIVLAVKEGRCIFNNMKAFIRYLISSNIGEVASIFLTTALGIPDGLAPVYLLWVNLVTDGFPATALGFNPPDIDVMMQKPRKKDESLITPWIFFRYLVIGLYVGFATVGIFIWWYLYGVDPHEKHTLISFWQLSHWSQCQNWESFTAEPVYGMNPNDPCTYFNEGKAKAASLSITVLVIIEMLNALNALSEKGSLFQITPLMNPWLILAITGSIVVHCFILYIKPLSALFGIVPLTFYDWIHVLLWSLPVIFIDELLKLYLRYTEKHIEHDSVAYGKKNN